MILFAKTTTVAHGLDKRRGAQDHWIFIGYASTVACKSGQEATMLSQRSYLPLQLVNLTLRATTNTTARASPARMAPIPPNPALGVSPSAGVGVAVLTGVGAGGVNSGVPVVGGTTGVLVATPVGVSMGIGVKVGAGVSVGASAVA